ncbi:hypothetical protein GQ54DRAFT_297760 [Martensiomyces pterosporus]|nr:hypothetical protein GQ54DRAFT_297760 [Martensiomyces pterosporus]
MGISAIFKRPKSTPSQAAMEDSSAKAQQGPRHIKRRSAPSRDSDETKVSSTASRHRQQQHASVSKKGGSRVSADAVAPAPERVKRPRVPPSSGSRATGKRPDRAKTRASSYSQDPSTTSTLSISDVEDLPTPEESLSEVASHPRRGSSKGGNPAGVAPSARGPAGSMTVDTRGRHTNSSLFGLYSLTTPPLDTHPPRLKQPDPFEDSPPARPLTGFEDPVYIPPLTLTATLADDYSAVDTALSAGKGATAAGAGRSATAAASATAATRATAAAIPATTSAGTGSLDLLGEFNATYNYLFGTLPSDAIAAPSCSSSAHANDSQHGTATNSAARPKARSRAEASTKATDKPLAAEDSGSLDDSSEASDAEGSSLGSDYESCAFEDAFEEERRKEEERKAAEMRNRRRELIKQQVAFERMKERHRKQYPGAAAGPKSISRWQRESANAMGIVGGHNNASGYDLNSSSQPAYAQNPTLYASNGTISRNYMHAPIQPSVSHQGHPGAHGSGPSNTLYSNANANASMPNISYAPDSQYPGNTAYFQAGHVPPMLPPQQQQQHQLPASGTANAGAYPAGQPYGGTAVSGYSQVSAANMYHSASIPAGAPSGHTTPHHNHNHPLPPPLQHQQQPLLPTDQPAPAAAYPVKLASLPKSTKNPYLSDSSDEASDSSLLSSDASSEDCQSTGSSDLSYDKVLMAKEASSQPAKTDSVDAGITSRTVSRSTSQSVLADDDGTAVRTSSSDASSDLSATGSQSSSKRRVRFHETVSVVFNTRNSMTEDDFEREDGVDSDNDSSNASVSLKDMSSASPGQRMAASTNGSAPHVGSYPSDDAFDSGNAYSHVRYQMPHGGPPSVSASHREASVSSTAGSSSKQSSATSSRSISPDGARGRKHRPKKHRIETQPLRDREAEREERMRKAAKPSMPLAPNVLASGHQPLQAPPSAKLSRNPTKQTASAVSSQANAPPAPPAATPSKEQAVDHMAEARRALLGHYNMPNPSLPVGNSIPRSGAVPVLTQASSVKVIQPPSFSRPKPSNSPGSEQNRVPRVSGRYHKARPIEEPKPQGELKAEAPASLELHEQEQRPLGDVIPGGKPAASAPRKISSSRRDFDVPGGPDLDSSQEFNFGSVIQNFSISSFEVTTSKEGGMYIRYSDKDSAAGSRININRSSEGDDDSNIDGDDIPLSAIARSRSEPSATADNPPRHSADNYLARLAASNRDQPRTYDSDANINVSAKRSRRLFGRSRNESSSSKQATEAAAANHTKVEEQVAMFEQMRSLSMDNGSRQASSAAKQRSANVAASAGKRRFGRWGSLF